ncbi:MAG: FAD:protein FMN transferase [Phycisphaerae bacterium]|jgi:thiamine biosynthesis lipoprotein
MNARLLRNCAGRALLGAALLLSLAACDRPSGPQRVSGTYAMMGTEATITVIADEAKIARRAASGAFARLGRVNFLMSDYTANSEIGLLNRLGPNRRLVVSPETFACVEAALNVAERSGGAFDPTCRPLVHLWKEAGKAGRLPSAEALAEVRQRVGWQKVRLNHTDHSVALTVDGMQLDLGGIAKGYALDLAAKGMLVHPVKGGLVDVGGDIVAFGKQEDGGLWHVGIRDPFQPDHTKSMFVLELTDLAVCTSGMQERFYEIEGRRYSHIVDPRTGQPAAEAPAVTVIGPDGMTADAWATTLSVLSVAEGQTLLAGPAADVGLEVMWITGTADAPQITKTAGFDRYLVK